METIKKPSFLRMFLIRSVALVLVFLCISFVWISYYAEKQREKNFNRLLAKTHYLGSIMQEIYEQGTISSQTSKDLLTELQYRLDDIWKTDGTYISANIMFTKIAETRDRAIIVPLNKFPIFLVNDDSYYELKDMSVLPPEVNEIITDYQYRDNDPVRKLIGSIPLPFSKVTDVSQFGFREFYVDENNIALPGMLQNTNQSILANSRSEITGTDIYQNHVYFYTTQLGDGEEEIAVYIPLPAYEDYLDLTPEDTSGYTLSQEENIIITFVNSYEHPLTEDDVNYCYGYSERTNFYKLDSSAESPLDIYSDYSLNMDKDSNLPITRTPYFPSLDWSLRIAYNDHPSAFEMMPYTCIAVPVLSVIIALLTALIWAYLAYRRERRIWNILESRSNAIEVMARDLKTPIEEITSSLKTVREGFTLDPGPHYNSIEQNTDKMNRKIEDILDYTHSESGSVSVEPEFVDLDSLVKQSIKDHDMAYKVASLKTEFKGSSMTVETDPKLFKQALDNLLSNCAHHADHNSTVTINLTTTELTVSNKTSLEIKNVKDLKKPFVKGENEAGTGLGLSIAENNLRLLGYSLDLSLKDSIFTAKIKF